MSLVPEEHKSASGQSLEVTRTYLQRGQSVSRSLWVTISPRHPLLKLVMIPPIIGLMLAMSILILLVLGFALLAVALLWGLSKAKHEESEGQ